MKCECGHGPEHHYDGTGACSAFNPSTTCECLVYAPAQPDGFKDPADRVLRLEAQAANIRSQQQEIDRLNNLLDDALNEARRFKHTNERLDGEISDVLGRLQQAHDELAKRPKRLEINWTTEPREELDLRGDHSPWARLVPGEQTMTVVVDMPDQSVWEIKARAPGWMPKSPEDHWLGRRFETRSDYERHKDD